MSKRAFDKIAAGLNDAIAIARGEVAPARPHVPSELDVRAIRSGTGLSQADFAYRFGFTADQIKAWEQGRSRPLGGVRAYLMMIEADHEAVAAMLGKVRARGPICGCVGLTGQQSGRALARVPAKFDQLAAAVRGPARLRYRGAERAVERAAGAWGATNRDRSSSSGHVLPVRRALSPKNAG